MGKVSVFASPIHGDDGDASRALNAEVQWQTGTPRLEKAAGEVQFNMAVIGPALRRDAPAFMKAVRSLPPEDIEHPPDSIDIGGRKVQVPPGSLSLQYSYLEAGERVDVITVGDAIVTVHTAP